MFFHILTLFPEMIENALFQSIIGRALERGDIKAEAVNIRDYTIEKHGKVDDYCYGGGAGMLMQAQPVYDCIRSVLYERIIKDGDNKSKSLRESALENDTRIIYVTPQGKVFKQEDAIDLSKHEHLIFLCGHYEGIDERVLEEAVTDHYSIGDYVLTGGELPALVMTDAISRMIPGVLSNDESASTESHTDGLLEYPQYSRPQVWNGKEVPAILLSGDHAKVDAWRSEQSLKRTKERRPDMYEEYVQRKGAKDI
ncbi:MAG TPA: tRNA (guanosine(37)-N1)-methyltransferase TrmD [Lachnospiraceae bacterium]|nr:tRNA (guanosine(37)-N1)-methyltransferase TrmD [Lachnospiraceae bacterium]